MVRILQILGLFCAVCQICYASLCGDVECVKGTCTDDKCYCNDCYMGPSCRLFKNKPPRFEDSIYKVSLPKESVNNDVLVKVSAEDEDSCLETDCNCRSIVYSILDESEKDTFKIDPATGEIQAIQGTLKPDNKYSIAVKASNKSPFDNVYDTATVFITIDGATENVLERHRRAAAPTDPSFSLIQIFPVTNLTTIYIGQRLTLQLTITFPAGTNSLGVELFTSETTTDPVLTICGQSMTSNGSSLTYDSIVMAKQEGVKGAVWPLTHIVYNFTNVVSIPSPTNLADIQVTILFDAVMQYSSGTINGATYYVSAGAEYYNGTQIWVGQLGYVANMTTKIPSTNISITGDTIIYPGRTAVFDITIRAPDSYIFLNMGIYTPLNNSAAMSLCIVNRYYVGAAYSCLPVTYNTSTLSQIIINGQVNYNSASMILGNMANRYYMEPSHTDINEVTISIKIAARINPNLWVGNTYYLGISLNNIPTSLYTTAYVVNSVATQPLAAYGSPVSFNVTGYSNLPSINIGSPSQMLMMITVPTGSELDYTITVQFPSNDAEICGAQFFKAGANIPCLDQVTFSSNFTQSSDGYATLSSTVIPSVRHVKISNDSNDDILQILINFRTINDSRNTPSKVLSGTVQLSWNGGSSNPAPVSFTLASPVIVNVDITNMPNFTLNLVNNNGNVSVDTSYQLYFSMRLQPGMLYGPAVLEFFMPFNGTTRMQLCSASVTYVGKNVMCFNPTFITSRFVFSSKVNDTINFDKLQIPLGVLCTITPAGVTPSLNDEVQISFNILVLSHSMNTVGATTNINAGMMITTTQIWVGNQPITFITKPAIPTLTASNYPLMFVQRVDATNNIVFQNDLVILNYVIKIAPAVVTSMNLKISTNITTANNFGVCGFSIKRTGSSIPCVNGTMTQTPWSPFSKYNKDATFTFTNILNSGNVSLVNSPSFDDNSILVEVIVKFGSSIPASVNVAGLLTFNGGTISVNSPFVLQTTLSRFNGTTASTEPVFNMFLSPLFNNSQPNVSSIGYSEAMRSVVSVQVQPAALQSLKLIFASAPSTINQMDVISVNILSVGRNIPCLQPGMMSFVVQQRTGSLSKDLTSLDLGTICHRQYLTNTTIEDNKIYIEAVFRVWRTPVGNPTSLQINVLGLLNNDQIYVTRIVFNTSPQTLQTSDTNLNSLNPSVTANVSATSVAVGGIFNVSVYISVPPYTQFISSNILVSSPSPSGSDSFCFVGNGTNYTGFFGNNIGVNSGEVLSMNLSSSMNTSQMNQILVNLGVIQNFATSYRLNQNNFTNTSIDDTFFVTIPVQLTDNAAVYNGFPISFQVQVDFGSFKTNISLSINGQRLNNEIIDFSTNSTLLTSNIVYTSSDQIIVSTQAVMSNLSKLECRNFTVYVAAPPFIQYSGMTNSSYSSPGFPIVTTNITTGGFYFTVPYFFYKENISIIFSMSPIQNLNFTKNRMQSIVTIPIIYGCKTLNWTQNALGNRWFNKVDPIVVTVKGTDLNITAKSCNDNLMVTDNTVIKDCAISAYMSPFPLNTPLMVRSNSNSYWAPHIRTGLYNKLRYIDIRFGTLTTVSKLMITSTLSNKPQIIGVYGTMDGRSYSFYQNISLSYTGNIANALLSNPMFIYRGIRVAIIQALMDDQMTGLNIDMFGCLPPNVTDPNKFDPCTIKSFATPATPLPEFYYRGFLFSTPHIFICDEIANGATNLDTYPRCFRSNAANNFNTWEDLGSQVGKVIGFDSNAQIIYGISTDLTGYIMSEDNGLTWIAMNGGGWQLIRNLNNLQSPTLVPWSSNSNFNSNLTGTTCTAYTASTLTFCFDGIYSGSTRIYSWNSCCSL